MTQQPRHAGPGLALSRDLPVQHLAHGHELDRARQQGLLDRHAQAHRGARSGGCGAPPAGGRRRTRRPRRTRRRRAAAAMRPAGGDTPGGGGFGGAARAAGGALQHRPARSARCAIRAATSFPSDQADFANATEFVNALLKNGITIHQGDRGVHRGRQELSGGVVRGEDRAGLPAARARHVRAAGPSQRFRAIPAARRSGRTTSPAGRSPCRWA